MLGRNFRDVGISYLNFMRLHDSGFPILQSLQFLRDTSLKDNPREVPKAEMLIAKVANGSPLYIAMKEAHLPRLDVAVIRAAEQTGAMGPALELLSRYYDQRFEIERAIKTAFIKPSVLFCVSLFTMAIPGVAAGKTNLLQFFSMTFLPMIAFAIILFAGFEVFRRASYDVRLEETLIRLIMKLRWTGRLSVAIATEKFCMCYLMCIRAGCDFNETLSALKDLSSHPALRPAIVSLGANAKIKGVSEALALGGLFDSDQITGLRVAEQTGRFEEEFVRLSVELRSEVRIRITQFRDWIPRLIYAVSAVFVVINLLLNVQGN